LLSPLLAVLAAAANALASLLQRKAAREESTKENLTLRLVWHLLHRPVWLAGFLSVIASFLLQATALGTGQISVVEPLMALELPMTLALSAWFFHSRLHRREWGAAAVMTAGLATLLVSLSPHGGHTSSVPWQGWVAGCGINLLVVSVGVGWARTTPTGARRAAALGATTGCAFGLTAGLRKGMTSVVSQGFAALFTSWQLYAMIVTGVGAMFLLQSALNAGRLLATQPGLTMADPVVSILWGVLVFDEQVRGGMFVALAIVAAAVTGGATIVLSRSPLLSGEAGLREEDRRGEPQETR
jgi:drug/metabolite transporter (DMT)-like permease